ncbi:hypothetical protein [Oscillibacter sp.]|uniref:hypothetical protein n=1 Tax=Oscillibacter sp. TaxID=1945593 RepID=UPI003392682A
MQKSEVESLFNLLEQFYPNAKQLCSKTVQAAWVLALEPYAYEDAKAAAIAYARKNKFFPDVADITGGLSHVEPEAEEAKSDPAFGDYSCMKKHVAALRDVVTALDARYHAAGVVTLREARAQGMGYDKWAELCRNAGV